MRFTTLRLVLTSLILGISAFLYLSQPSRFADRPILADESKPDSPNSKSALSGKPHHPILPHNSTADAAIHRFWKEWARHISDAKPKTGKITVGFPAANVRGSSSELDMRRTRPEPHIAILADDVASLKGSHAQFMGMLEDFSDNVVVEKVYAGTGIVTVAGGEFYGPSLVGLRLLRQTGSTLPVEVFLPNWEEYEPDLCETVYPALNARCIVLSDFLAPENEEPDKSTDFEVTHYQLKSLALLFSSFKQILYLDSDSIPLLDPQSELFSQPPYTDTGFVGWPDFWIGTEAFQFYTIAGLGTKFPTYLPQTSSEAGQLLVDKRKHLKTLLLAAYYNVWGPDYYYPLLSQGGLGQGDKNTFETAAIVLGLDWYRVVTPVKQVGRIDSGEMKGSGMVQFHPTDDYRKYGHSSKESESESTSTSSPIATATSKAKASKAASSSFLDELDSDVDDLKLLSRRKEKDADSIRPAFLHANTPKMNSGHLVDEGDLDDSSTGTPLRLWGPAKEQVDRFGEDLEKRVWKEVVTVGCELADVVWEWQGRDKLCERLKEHYSAVFGKE